MPGIESSAHASEPEPAELVSFSVHSLPLPAPAGARRTARGRLLMFAVLAVCAAPVVAAYLAYFVVRPDARTNYSDLVAARPAPAALPLHDLAGRPVAPASLRGQWLVVAVAGGACDAGCERLLWLQRQLHEALGRERGRVDKVWLVDDGAVPSEATLRAINAFGAGSHLPFARATVLQVPRQALSQWLLPASGRSLEDHLYIVDPQGDWMMRAPAGADPVRLKRDIEKLLRASAGWDVPGR